MNPYGHALLCPDCLTPIARGTLVCHRCELPLTGPAAKRLWQVVTRLQQLEQERFALYAQRDGLLRELRALRDARRAAQLRAAAPRGPAPAPMGAAPPSAPAGESAASAGPQPRPEAPVFSTPSPAAPSHPGPRAQRRPRREISARSVQNILLGLGGSLVAVAALVFTIVTWSDLGVGMRSLILGGATALTAYAARPLLRRGMSATAETVGVLATVLVCLDGLALWLVADPPLPPTGYAAVVLAVACALSALYPKLAPLRGPRVMALLLAQPIPLLVGVASTSGAGCVPLALAATALGDVALRPVLGSALVRLARVLAVFAWAGSVAASVLYALASLMWPALFGGVGGFWAAAALVAAGAAALLAARSPAPAGSSAVFSGGTALAWLLVPPALAVGVGAAPVWAMTAFAVSAAAAALIVTYAPAARHRGARWVVVAALTGSGVVGSVSALPLLGLFAQAARPWQGRFTLVELPDPWVLGLGVILAAAGTGLSVLAAASRREWAVTVALATAALVAAVLGQRAGHTSSVGILAALAVALMVAAVAIRPPAQEVHDGWWGAAARRSAVLTALTSSLLLGALAVCGSLAAQWLAVATVGSLAVAVVAGAAAAAPLRSAAAVRVAYSAAAVLLVTGAVAASGRVWTIPAPVVVALLLGVTLAVAGTATVLDRWGGPRDQTAALDAALAAPLLTALVRALEAGPAAVGIAAAVSTFAVLSVSGHRRSLPDTARRGAAAAAGLLLACAGAVASPLLAQALLGPLGQLSAPWEGAVGPLVPGEPSAALTVAAGLALTAVIAWTALGRPAILRVILVVAAVVAALIGASWLPGMGLAAALTVLAVVLLGGCVLADRRHERRRFVDKATEIRAGEANRLVHRVPRTPEQRLAAIGRPVSGPVPRPVPPPASGLVRTTLGLSGFVGLLAAAASFIGPGTTIAVLGVLMACAGTAAVFTSSALVRTATSTTWVLALTGLVTAGLTAGGAPPVAMALGTAAVAAIAVGCATVPSRLGGRVSQVVALDAAATVPMAAAIGWAATTGTDLTALVIALSALLTLVVSTHTAHRPVELPPSGSARLSSAPARNGATALPLALSPQSAKKPVDVRQVLNVFSAVLGTGALLLVGDRIWAVLASPGMVARLAWTPFAAQWQTLPVAGQDTASVPVMFLAACAVALTALTLCAGLGRGHGSVLSAATAGAGLFVPLALAHLPVRYDAALGIAVAAAGLLLWQAAHGDGRSAHIPAWSGVFVAAMTVGWALATPLRTVLVLAVLGVLASAATIRATAGMRTSAPLASRLLALVAGLASALSIVTGYAALPFGGVDVDQRWLPFVALAAAGTLAVAAQMWAGGSGRRLSEQLRAALAPNASSAREWAARGVAPSLFPDRPEQRGGLVGAALTMVLVASLATITAPESLGLITALAALLLFAVAAGLARGPGWAVTGMGGLALLVAVVTVSRSLSWTLFAPYAWVSAVWTGAGPEGLSTPAESTLTPWGGTPIDPLLLPIVTVSALAVLVVVRTRAARALVPTTVMLATPVLTPYAISTGMTYGVALSWVMLVATALAGTAALARAPRVLAWAGAASLWPASLAVAWGLAEPATTLVTLGLLAAVAASCLMATAPSAPMDAGRSRVFPCGAAVVAVLSTGGFALALPLALGQSAQVAALAVLVVVAVVVLTPYLARLNAPVLAAAECAAGALGVVVVLLTLSGGGRLELTSAALACLGVIAAAGAPRPGRTWLGVVGAVLLLAAGWVFLGWLRVTAPEPYTVVPALAALAAGSVLRRSRPNTSTWLVYGPGLVLLLAPGLVLTLTAETEIWRIAALGAGSLAVTLAGARWRLQAPLLVGAVVLLLTTAKAFGPPVWDIVLALPNWIPVGAVGLLLLAVGARYEQRLRDIRRLGRALRDMD